MFTSDTRQEPGRQLDKYDAAVHALAEAKRIDDVKSIRDKAVALKVYARQAKDRRLIESAAAIQLRAERRAGELLLQSEKNKGSRGHGRPPRLGGRRQRPPKKDETPKLADLGISKSQSSNWQDLARLDTGTFETHVAEAQGKARRSLDGIHRELKRQQKREAYRARIEHGCIVDDLRELVDSGRKFGVIYADFPWDYETFFDKGKDRSAAQHYDTLGIAEIDAITPLLWGLAAPNCAFFSWATWAHYPLALKVDAACGFQYSTCAFVWVKTNPTAGAPELADLKDTDLHFGMGHVTRLGSEPVLLGLRGAPVRLNNDVRQVVLAPVGEHSEKPDEVRRRIERLYPGPYLELFGRKSVPGWSVWGNEILRDDFKNSTTVNPTVGPAGPAALLPADGSIPDFLRRSET